MQGLIRLQAPMNRSIKRLSECERLYDAAIDLLNSKPIVGGALPTSNRLGFGQKISAALPDGSNHQGL